MGWEILGKLMQIDLEGHRTGAIHITRSASTRQLIRLGNSDELLPQMCIALMVRQCLAASAPL